MFFCGERDLTDEELDAMAHLIGYRNLHPQYFWIG